MHQQALRHVEAWPGGTKRRVDGSDQANGQHEQQGEHQAGENPGQQELADGLLGHNAIEDER